MIYPTALLHLIKPSNTIIKIPLLDTIQFQPLNDDNSWSISVHSKAIIVSVQRMDSFHFHLPTLALLLRLFSPPPMARSHLAITFVSIKDWKRALIKQSIFLFSFSRRTDRLCSIHIFLAFSTWRSNRFSCCSFVRLISRLCSMHSIRISSTLFILYFFTCSVPKCQPRWWRWLLWITWKNAIA